MTEPETTANLPAIPQQPIPPDLVKEMAMDIGKEVAAYIERQYPEAVKATSSTFLLSVRNATYNEIIAAIGTSDADEIKERLARRKLERRRLRAMWKAVQKMKPGDGSPEAVARARDIIEGRIPMEPDL